MNPHPDSLLREPTRAAAHDDDRFGSGREVKNLAAQSKKNLAREVLRLRSLLQALKADLPQLVKPEFQHREAFALMTYVQKGVPEGQAGEVLYVWNSRDGVTPFTVFIGDKEFQHDLSAMSGPFYDVPALATHKWETRSDAETLEAFQRTLQQAVDLGRISAAKALDLGASLQVAESWHYRIGLRSIATGNFTDKDSPRTIKEGL